VTNWSDRLIVALAVHLRIARGGQHGTRQHRLRRALDGVGADEVGDLGIFRAGPGQLGLVGEYRGVVDVDFDGQNVADLMRALIIEEGARAVTP
jgi:hypothetical protein